MARILIIRTGSTALEVQAAHGDYDRWFADAMADSRPQLDLCDVTREEIPSTEAYSGVIITGSTSAAYRPEPWMERLSAYLKLADGLGHPVLCVCFGAQMLAHARGGRVNLNPAGWEIGGIEVRLTPEAAADPLFGDLPPTMKALATHEDRVEELPPGAVLLAGNDCAPVQAYRVGRRVWGVQFHPEITPSILDILIGLRARELERDAAAHGRDPRGHISHLFATLRDQGAWQGRRILDNFASLCLRPLEATAPGHRA